MNKSLLSAPKTRQYAYALSLFLTSAPVFAQGAPAAVPALPIIPPPGAAAPATPATPAVPGVAAPAVVAEIAPEAGALLEKSLARYSAIKSYSVSVETRNERPGVKIQNIQYKAPVSVALTNLDATGAKLSSQVYTATESTTLQKVNDVWEYRTAALPEVPDAKARLANLRIGGPYFSSLLVGLNPFREGSPNRLASLTIGAPATINGTTVKVLVAKLQKPPRGRYETNVTFYIGAEDSLIRKIQTDTKAGEEVLSSTTETHSKIVADAQIADAEFVFTAPAGATKVETFSRPKIKAVVGESPLGLTPKDITGKDISFEQYKGKVVLVDFWATWCGPCIAELPNVKANYAKYKDQGFDVLGISLDRSTDPLTKYIATNDMPWRQVFDGYWDGPLATSWNVRAIPATVLIGKDGKVAAVGVRGPQLEPAIQAALAK